MRSKIYLLLMTTAFLFSCKGTPQKGASPTPAVTPAGTTGAAAKPTQVAAAPTLKKNEVTCKLGAEARTLSIEPVQPQGCKLWYSNFSKTEPVAQSTKGSSHCDQTSAKIQEKLTAAGFKCETMK